MNNFIGILLMMIYMSTVELLNRGKEVGRAPGQLSLIAREPKGNPKRTQPHPIKNMFNEV